MDRLLYDEDGEVPGYVEPEMLLPKKEDALEMDIYECVSEYSDGMRRRWSMDKNCVVLGYPGLEGLLPPESEDARWFLLMVKYFGLDVVVGRELGGFSAWLGTRDRRYVSPMNGRAMPCRHGATARDAVQKLAAAAILARNNMKQRFGGRFRLSKLGTRDMFNDGWVADMECPGEIASELEMKVALRGL